MTNIPSVSLSVAARIHHLLLRLVPMRDRERFGRETEEAFESLLADTHATRGPFAAAVLLVAACLDLGRAGIIERLRAVRYGLLAGITADVRQAMRIFRREPVLASVVTVTLALVSGPAMAAYTALNQLVLRPLPYPDSERLVMITHETPQGAVRDYLVAAAVSDYRNVTGFSWVGGVAPFAGRVGINGTSEQMLTLYTTAGLLRGLGVPLAAGRDIEFSAPEVVVSRGFALARFGGESVAIGQIVTLNEVPHSIVGVLAFAPVLPVHGDFQLFVPHKNADHPDPSRGGTNTRVIAKLEQGVSIEQAREQARAVATSVVINPREPDARPELVPLARTIAGAMREPLMTVFGAAGALFLIAIASLANLSFARAAARAPDVAVRTALGASRWRLVRAWSCEGLVLAAPGTLAGGLIGALLVSAAEALVPQGSLPMYDTARAKPLLAAGLVFGVGAAACFAAAPALGGLLRPMAESLRSTTMRVIGLRRRRWQATVTIAQVAVTCALLTSSIWLSTSLERMLTRPMGFNAENLLALDIMSGRAGDDRDELNARMFEKLSQQYGLDAVARSTIFPGVSGGSFRPARIYPADTALSPDDRPVLVRGAISTNYFRILGIPTLAGRVFGPGDESTPDNVIVVSRSFAARWFPDGAVGQVVSFASSDPHHRTIIGVVEDVHAGRLDGDSSPQYYSPLSSQSFTGGPATFLVRTTQPVSAVRANATQLLRIFDPTAHLEVRSVRDVMAGSLSLRRLTRQLITALAVIALLIAVINVYATAAYLVVQRARELAIRIALGAVASSAVGLVMRRGLVWVAMGLVFGAVMTAFVAAPLVRSQLFQTEVGDLRLAAVAFGVMASAALVASWLPARRVARIDPAIILKAE